MLNKFFQTQRGRQRHLNTPLAPYLDGYLLHRYEQGHAHSTLAADLKWITAFGEYVKQRKLSPAAALTERGLERFVEHYRRHPRRFGPRRKAASWRARNSLRSFLAYLRAAGLAQPAVVDGTDTAHDSIIAEYLSFLRVHRGFIGTTIEQRQRYCVAFFDRLGHPCLDESLASLTSAQVETIAVELARGLGRRSRQQMTATIKSLLGYLRGAGRVPLSCVPFLPHMKTYALSSLPSVIPHGDVQRAVAGIDRSTPLGQRNYTMALLVVTYGLRANDVVGLRLEHIDWRSGALRIRQKKTRRPLHLPILPLVRDALVDHLRNRGDSERDRYVFLKAYAPRGGVSEARCTKSFARHSSARGSMRPTTGLAPYDMPSLRRSSTTVALSR
jgi:integrase